MAGLMRNVMGKRGLRFALLLLCLVATGTVQLAAATHWHSSAKAAVAADSPAPQTSSTDGLGHDGCLLCQVAAHAGSTAPPPSPWVLASVVEAAVACVAATQSGIVLQRPSHSWQGRAPPRI